MSDSSQHILYADESQSVVVVDIPASIASAQVLGKTKSASTVEKVLISCPPLLQPYQTPEPKVKLQKGDLAGGRAIHDNGGYGTNDERDKGAHIVDKPERSTAEDSQQRRYIGLIRKALVEVRERYGGPLCGRRSLGDGVYWDDRVHDCDYERASGGKGKGEERGSKETVRAGEEEEKAKQKEKAQAKSIDEPKNLGTLLACLCESENMASRKPYSYILSPTANKEDEKDVESLDAEDCFQNNTYSTWEGFAQNPGDDVQTLSIYDNCDNISSKNSSPHSFYIPPRSAFLLNSCSDAASFHAAVRNMSQGDNNYRLSRQFDIILLDPPWPNASAKRKRKHGKHSNGEGYSTQPNLRQTRNLLYAMDLDRLIAPNGLVSIWITNKPAVRSFVLGPGGLFEQLNVRLVEEWVWVKVTYRGEPVTPLDGEWRKPYEVLLLGRAPADRLTTVVTPVQVEGQRQGSAPLMSSSSSSSSSSEVKYKVLVAVPDLHSRKPCLKALLEPMVSADGLGEVNDIVGQGKVKYACRALEVFARHLVAGWWSWGDQVLLYQWKASWSASGATKKSLEGRDQV